VTESNKPMASIDTLLAVSRFNRHYGSKGATDVPPAYGGIVGGRQAKCPKFSRSPLTGRVAADPSEYRTIANRYELYPF